MKSDFDVIVSRLEALMDSNTPQSTVTNFDLPRLVEWLAFLSFLS